MLLRAARKNKAITSNPYRTRIVLDDVHNAIPKLEFPNAPFGCRMERKQKWLEFLQRFLCHWVGAYEVGRECIRSPVSRLQIVLQTIRTMISC